MKNLLKILLGGFVVFQVLAIAQEWDLFAAAWLGTDREEPSLSLEHQRAAAAAVDEALTLLQHFYLSGGDARFADRMPVSEAFLEEARRDVAYLARNGRLQDPVLEELVVQTVEAAGPGRATVGTRERWRVRELRARDGEILGPPRVQLTYRQYRVSRQGTGWRVEGWELAGPPEPDPASPPEAVRPPEVVAP